MTTLDEIIYTYLPFDHVELLKLDVEGEDRTFQAFGFWLQIAFLLRLGQSQRRL